MPRLNKLLLAILLASTALMFAAGNTARPAYADVWCSCNRYVANLLGIPAIADHCADQAEPYLAAAWYFRVPEPQVNAVLIIDGPQPGFEDPCGHIAIIQEVQSAGGGTQWRLLMKGAAQGPCVSPPGIFSEAGCNNVCYTWKGAYPKSDTTKRYWVRDTAAPLTSAALSGTMGNNGWYRSSVQVTLTATDDHSGVAGTWYSIDGVAYGPLNVSGQANHTVSYYSWDNAGNQEGTKSTSFKIDSVPPSTSASGFSGTPGENGWYRSGGQLTLGSSDATSGVARVAYRLDGTAEQTYSGGIAVSGDAAHSVEHWAIDNAGNTGSPITSPVPIDGTPPSGYILLNNGSDATPGAAVAITAPILDNASGTALQRFSNDGANWSEWGTYWPSSNWTIPVVNGVPSTVHGQFKDAAGNVSETLTDSITPIINVQPSASASYRLLKGTTAAGGLPSTSTSYRLKAAAGQPAPVGRISSSGFTIISGFFAPVTQAPPPPAVGGIAELPDIASWPLDTRGQSGPNRGLVGGLAGVALVAVMALAGGAWYAKRRRYKA